MSTVITQQDAVFNITGGTRPDQGPNLFHSFGQFDVGTGDTAHFVAQPGIANIIGRVTGGHASHIDGRLQSDATLFLLNPSGLLFGPNATLDINGSFHASTADVLRFADGATFSAHLNEKSTLTVASPMAFGFLSENPPGIAIEGSSLQVPEGETISIVGGDVKIMGLRSADDDPPTVFAPSGQINLVSVASPGNVTISSPEHVSTITVDNAARLGVIDVSQRAFLSVSGDGGGTVAIRGGRLLVDNTRIFADTEGDSPGAPVGINVETTEEIILRNGALVTADLLGAGNAGRVVVEAPQITLSGGAQIQSATLGRGQGGSVTVRATERIILEGPAPGGTIPSVISAGTVGEDEAAGGAGHVVVEASQITLSGGAQISSNTAGMGQGGSVTVRATERITMEGTAPSGTIPSVISASALGQGELAGDAGRVVVEAPQITLSGGAQIQSGTLGRGQGGSVTVRATERITLEGTVPNSPLPIPSAIFANALGQGKLAGDAGRVVVEAPQVFLSGGAQISSSTFGMGQGGSVTVRATDRVTLEGTAPDSVLYSAIATNAQGKGEASGDAGRVVVEAPQITLSGGAQIASGTLGRGQGGSVTVRATDRITMEGTAPGGAYPSAISANAQGKGEASGDAGHVVMEAPQITLSGGAQIASGTLGRGQGGSVTVTVTDIITISGRNSGLFTNTEGNAAGGDIILQAPTIQLAEGARVSAQSTETGNAGTIRILATDTLLLSSSSAVTTEAAQASGGNIEVTAQSMVRLQDSAITATVEGGPGTNGGNITMGAEFIILENSHIVSDAFQGRGGDIAIEAVVLLADPTSSVSAKARDSEVGIDGQIDIRALVTNLSGLVTPLPPGFVPAAELLRDRCAAQLHEGNVSSLVARGRAGVPAAPEGILPGRLYQPSPMSAPSHKTERQPGKTEAPQQGMLAVAPLNCRWREIN